MEILSTNLYNATTHAQGKNKVRKRSLSDTSATPQSLTSYKMEAFSLRLGFKCGPKCGLKNGLGYGLKYGLEYRLQHGLLYGLKYGLQYGLNSSTDSPDSRTEERLRCVVHRAEKVTNQVACACVRARVHEHVFACMCMYACVRTLSMTLVQLRSGVVLGGVHNTLLQQHICDVTSAVQKKLWGRRQSYAVL